ncbi:MAG: GNAT family N-acetyltransferase [Chitinophagales bacterium]|jgi:GNAT superfamily N-acetyltransferase|nr:GNAT family N-acetyltransferase [Chitinophagales bacterium]
MNIRKIEVVDLPQVLDLILELAEFEKGLHEVTNSLNQMEKDFEAKLFDCIVAELDEKIVGMSLYYFRYSTWKGKRFYLEDLIVTKSYQGSGIGKALFDYSIQIARDENCSGMTWQVLDWNTPAIDFYKKYQVSFDGQWVNVGLEF